jgi:hypothetical protein
MAVARKFECGLSPPEPTRAHPDVIQWPLRNILAAHVTSLTEGPPKLTQSLSDGRPSISPLLV